MKDLPVTETPYNGSPDGMEAAFGLDEFREDLCGRWLSGVCYFKDKEHVH